MAVTAETVNLLQTNHMVPLRRGPNRRGIQPALIQMGGGGARRGLRACPPLRQLPEAVAGAVRDVLRSDGVRLHNAMKNTGTARYAFNMLQAMTLPKAYRPPKGTAGSNVT